MPESKVLRFLHAIFLRFARHDRRSALGTSLDTPPRRAAQAAGAIIIVTQASAASAGPTWPGDFQGRLAALAIIETLDAELLSHDSATLTLDRWCASHKLAGEGAKVTAERVSGLDKPAGPVLRGELAVGEAEPIRYRRVRLRCGDRVLSEADNWYVPSRLTPAINRVLDTTDVSFGRAVADLHFQRHTLDTDTLWHPLPAGWEMERSQPLDVTPMTIPDAILRHRAVLTLRDGTPFSEVVETYTGSNLDFPLDARR